MWSWVNPCPAVFVSLSMIYLCIYSPVFWVRFGLVYSLLPVFPVCQPCLVLIKDYYLSLRPRLRVPVSSLLCAPWHLAVRNSFGFIFNLIALMFKLRFTRNILTARLCKRNTAVKKAPYLFKVFANKMLLHFCSYCSTFKWKKCEIHYFWIHYWILCITIRLIADNLAINRDYIFFIIAQHYIYIYIYIYIIILFYINALLKLMHTTPPPPHTHRERDVGDHRLRCAHT